MVINKFFVTKLLIKIVSLFSTIFLLSKALIKVQYNCSESYGYNEKELAKKYVTDHDEKIKWD